VIERRFNLKAKPVRWLVFFLDPKFNWQAHVEHRLALGHYRPRTLARVMGANGTPRRLARKVARAVTMSTAAYGVEAIWEGQKWLADSFDKLTKAIGRTVVGTLARLRVRTQSERPILHPLARPWIGDKNDYSFQRWQPPWTHPNELFSHLERRTTRPENAYPYGLEEPPETGDWSRKDKPWKESDLSPETEHPGHPQRHRWKPYKHGRMDLSRSPQEWDGLSPRKRPEKGRP
jgi:hypothetical protein